MEVGLSFGEIYRLFAGVIACHVCLFVSRWKSLSNFLFFTRRFYN
jgi:hypothetical protein